MVRPSIEHPICDVQFRPASLGDGLVILQRSSDRVGVSKHTAVSHDPVGYTGRQCIRQWLRLQFC